LTGDARGARLPGMKPDLNAEFDSAFEALKDVFAAELKRLAITKDTTTEYTLNTQVASPFPQHKGAPMFFATVRKGKAYVSFHLFPLYMNAPLTATISPELKKRMQGKTCFNFRTTPDAALLKELKTLTKAGMKNFRDRSWA
jgi:hypothetical protein